MELNLQACYSAVQSHDNRFDGLFFTCVKSTGIYCRPVCPARTPKQEYCRFVATAAEAEKAGYRPCLRCRPERAPLIQAGIAGKDTLAHRVAAHINDTLLADEKVSDVARIFGVSDRHLRRIFTEAFGVELLQYVTTRRLLFAKHLLQDTALPVAQIAYAAGFGSPSRLTVQMSNMYKLTPAQLRKMAPASKSAKSIVLHTDYRPPLHWAALLSFLAGRATPLERITGDAYHRQVDGHEVTVKNRAANNSLSIYIPIELARRSHTILWQVRALFDLDANPLVIGEALSRDPFLKPLISRYPGIRVPGCWDSFETLLRTVIGQQISVAGAVTIMRRFVERIGITAAEVAASSPEAIAAIGMPKRRATTIWVLGDMVQSGNLRLGERDPALFYEQLVAVPGIGPWTAEYLCMRVLHWPDAFPAGDLGLQKALIPGERQTERQLLLRAEDWRPWRSYATMLLWKSLTNQGG